jgi:hypothetical protein
MSGSIYSNGRTDYAQGNAKSYVSTKPFKQEFLTYTVSTNSRFVIVGETGYVTSDDALCPAGRVLHVTGRKLYPGVNPGITKFLLSVYDPITFLNGFIDPSSSTFAKYDQNLPNFFDNGPTTNGSSIPPLGGQAGKLTLGDGADATTAVTVAYNAGDATVGRLTITGAAGTTQINTSGCRAGSRIFLTPLNGVTQAFTVRAAGGASDVTIRVPMGYSVSNGSDGYFSITTVGASLSASPIFNWVIVN